MAEKIVYFDGYCNVCNAFIDFLIRHDSRRVLRFAPLQGSTARARLPAGLVSDLSTMALEDTSTGAGAGRGAGLESSIVVESTAAILTIASLGGVYSVIKIFLLVPRVLRDLVYRWVANHRYLFAGRTETCRVPTAEERAQFLD
ncbi:MAG: thiol-disulfide oxidoreductase DCC family protein [Bdellovibrionales bacterium]